MARRLFSLRPRRATPKRRRRRNPGWILLSARTTGQLRRSSHVIHLRRPRRRSRRPRRLVVRLTDRRQNRRVASAGAETQAAGRRAPDPALCLDRTARAPAPSLLVRLLLRAPPYRAPEA